MDKKTGIVRLIDDGAGAITLAQNPKDVKLSYQPRLECKASGVCTGLVCKPGRITLARLSRVQGVYVMLIAAGEAIEGEPAWLEECGYPMWPHAFLKLDGDLDFFVQNLRSEYIHMAYGDLTDDLLADLRDAGHRAGRVLADEGATHFANASNLALHVTKGGIHARSRIQQSPGNISTLVFAPSSSPHWIIWIMAFILRHIPPVIQGKPTSILRNRAVKSSGVLKPIHPLHISRLKDPDVIITRDEEVAFLIEVKWGTTPGRPGSDLLIKPDEWEKMSRLLEAPALCRVRGPAVINGQRYRSPSFPVQLDYYTNASTKGVIVSDFRGLNQSLLQEFLRTWRQANSGFLIADIASGMGEISSLKDLLAR